MTDYLWAKTENVQKLMDESLKRQKNELISKFIKDDIMPFLELYKISPNSEEFIYWKERKEKWEGILND